MRVSLYPCIHDILLNHFNALQVTTIINSEEQKTLKYRSHEVTKNCDLPGVVQTAFLVSSFLFRERPTLSALWIRQEMSQKKIARLIQVCFRKTQICFGSFSALNILVWVTTRDVKEFNLYEFNSLQELTCVEKTTWTQKLTTF